jgi:octaprenyl-diphosphate synthase
MSHNPSFKQDFMTGLPQKTISPETKPGGSPLESLQAMFESDMGKVNAHILENMQSDVALIPQLASYLIAAGGKRIRPLLTLASTAICEGDMKRAHRLSAAVEFIHTATLLHDDVVDDSVKRRGQESANVLFGNEASVLVGDFLFSRAFQLMVADGSLDVLRVLSDASAIIAEGEVRQLSTQSDIGTTLDDYLAVIEGKTAALFAAACEVGPIIGGKDEALRESMKNYGRYLGIIFQVTDDVLDYDPARSKLGKTIGDDFREGKMTAPVIFAIQSGGDTDRDFWQRTLGRKEQEDGDFDCALALIAQHDAQAQSIAYARDYEQKARESLSPLPEGPVKTMLADLCGYIINRHK